MRFNHTLILTAALALATAAHAGSSSTSGGRSSGSGSSGGKSSSASSGKSTTAQSRGTGNTSTNASGRTGYRAANAPGPRPINRQNSTLGQRRSLIPSNGAQPSQHVTEIIRERESSGPGWLGTAFLISLLSRHDLSSSDRSWIEGRINSIRDEEESGAAEPPALLPAVHPKVVYTFKGIDAPLRVGEAASVSVSALANGQPVSVSCDHPAATNHNGHVEIAWTPDAPGVSLLTCKSGERQERRLMRVVAKGAS